MTNPLLALVLVVVLLAWCGRPVPSTVQGLAPATAGRSAAVDELSQRTARGFALAALTVAVVVVGPVPQLAQAFERTYAVAVVASEREARRASWRVPALAWRRRDRPSRSRPPNPRP